MSGPPILTAAEMRDVEARAIAAGTSVGTLMERAGAAVAEAAWRTAGGAPMLILCGPGNNGGDGYVAARLLRARGAAVAVAASAPPASAAAKAAAAAWGGEVMTIGDASPAPILIDALFGTGLSRAIEPATGARLVAFCATARWRIAIDLPSGVSADTGGLLGDVPRFDLTIALAALKPAHRLLPAAERCGQVVVADIGVTIGGSPLTSIARPALRAPGHDATKYTRGKLLVAGGAMAGAGRMAAMAGQRAGAGYVELLTEGADAAPHALVQRPWELAALEDERVGAIVIGPGLGRDAGARARLDAVLASGKRLLLDADALTLIGRSRHDRLAGHVLTPHMGEFVRLFGASDADRLDRVRRAAAESGAIILLKGADSIVAAPDGRASIAPLAPAWLASAGTGDVLSGIIGARLALGDDPFEAVQTGVWLHSEAARIAGPMLIADDLIAALPRAAARCLG